MTATAQVTVPLWPWAIPRGAAYAADKAVPLQDLTQEALDDLVGDWIEAVYAEAGKKDPWEHVTITHAPAPAPVMREAGPAVTTWNDAQRREYLEAAAAHADEGPLGEPAARSILEIALFYEALHRASKP